MHLNFFSHEKKTDRLYIVTENCSMVHRITIGVAVGDEKILVIDTGLGMTGSLRDYIEGFAGIGKPIICACTHGHPDHVGCAIQFDEAYLSSLDYKMLENYSLNTQQRFSDLEAWSLGNHEVEAYCREHYIENMGTVFKDVNDGDVFELGGVRIEAIAVPGHSEGSIAYFNRDEKYVFTGDAISTDVHLEELNLKGLLKYRDTINRFISIVGEDVRIYPTHLPTSVDINIAKLVAKACEEAAKGNIQNDPPGEPIMKAIGNNPVNRMHFAGNVCIAYKKSRFVD